MLLQTPGLQASLWMSRERTARVGPSIGLAVLWGKWGGTGAHPTDHLQASNRHQQTVINPQDSHISEGGIHICVFQEIFAFQFRNT